MKNTGLLMEMIGKYNESSYTHEYIFGFECKGNIYMVKADSKILPYILKIDTASRGAGHSLRFCPNMAQKTMLLSMGAKLICSKKFFEETFKSNKYNRGENFEKMVTELYGQNWEKDNIPFTKDGDITVNGIAYQIKFQKATFANEKQLWGL